MLRTTTRTETKDPLTTYRSLPGAGPSFLIETPHRALVGRGTRPLPFEDAERALGAGSPVVGFLGYDHVARLEPVPLPPDGPDLPESGFLVPETLLELAPERPPPPRPVRAARPGPSIPSRRGFEALVRRAKRHITAGDALQVVLSLRVERPTAVSPTALYRALRSINPSPYHFLLELGDVTLVGASPETLVRLRGTRASVNPIAGTAGPGDVEWLLASEKDAAEHVMLVDLGRNDLSRVCRPGTVRVERFRQVERYSHLAHLVSEVAGEIVPGTTPFDLLRACFPAGTVSGAPKVRAMQLISELEGYRRGPYAGAVGYALPGGELDTCIAIRTIALADGVATLRAGAGIVADSDPAAEYRECRRKLAALEAALEEAER